MSGSAVSSFSARSRSHTSRPPTTSPAPAALLLVLAAGCGGLGSTLDRLPDDAPARGYVVLPRTVTLPRSRLTADCGPETLCAVVTYWGKPATVEELSHLVRDPKVGGIYSADVPLYARRKGLKATVLEGTIGRLKKAVDRGVPPIVMVASGGGNFHFFVVSGYSDRERVVVVEEYGDRKRLLGYDEMEEIWPSAGRLLIELEVPGAEDLHRQAAHLEAEGLWAEAAEAYRGALALDPEHFEARTGLGNCLLAQGKLEAARDAYREALRLQPADARILNNLANVYVELGQELDEAERLAERAVVRLREALDREKREAPRSRALPSMERDLAHALGTLGQACRANGKPVPAIGAFKASYDHFPVNAFDARAKRLLEIGLCYRQLAMPAEARRHLERARVEARDPTLQARIDEALSGRD
ncbi:MAG TPA: tetratricopeptide repeat protein [Planctomycetota bacterium]|nr:tetratricopeptide repeat protein [Planctomycetota bacterium]